MWYITCGVLAGLLILYIRDLMTEIPYSDLEADTYVSAYAKIHGKRVYLKKELR